MLIKLCVNFIFVNTVTENKRNGAEKFNKQPQSPYVHWRTQGMFFGEGELQQEFFGVGGSTNSVEERGQRKRRSGGGSPLSGVPLSFQIS
jgi:hypothetical protein